ncbi:MAG: hypothetical protein KY455_12770 [Euryarchaeota archaeon]|nr:hypothetical protein [Euryarchaeota archaeon]
MKAEALDETKEVKLRLPVAHLIKLHGLKLVRGQNISDSVAEALERYFEALEQDDD